MRLSSEPSGPSSSPGPSGRRSHSGGRRGGAGEEGQTAAQGAETDRSQAGLLRGKALGLINRLRAVVADELGSDPDLPRDLATTLFAFADQTFGQRAASRAGQGKASEESEPV